MYQFESDMFWKFIDPLHQRYFNLGSQRECPTLRSIEHPVPGVGIRLHGCQLPMAKWCHPMDPWWNGRERYERLRNTLFHSPYSPIHLSESVAVYLMVWGIFFLPPAISHHRAPHVTSPTLNWCRTSADWRSPEVRSNAIFTQEPHDMANLSFNTMSWFEAPLFSQPVM